MAELQLASPRFRLQELEECASTNELLLSRRDLPEFSGSALLAKRQTGGLGRRGRAWWSGEGNLALSVGLRHLGPPEQVALYPFFLGLAALDVLESFLPLSRVQLKWPNDIYLDGKKLAGILAQARQVDGFVDVVIGIGMNFVEVPVNLDQEAISLSSVITPPDVTEFAQKFLSQLEQRLQYTHAFEDLRYDWEKGAKLESTSLTVVGESGVWIPLRLLPSGELEVKLSDSLETRRLASETVSIRLQANP